MMIRPSMLPEDVRKKVLSKVAPDPLEREMVEGTADRLLEATREALRSMGVEGVEPVLAGSVAKGTYSRSPDIDIFLLFPSDTSDATLEDIGLAVGAHVLKDPVRKYTQHPYTAGTFMGMQCDMVPCIKVGKGEKVRTAVDRTPHHVGYINSTLRPQQREEVLLLKSFLKGIGAYGAEDTVRGFSGYLVELLVIACGGFEDTIRTLSAIRTVREPPLFTEEVSDQSWLAEEPVVMDVTGGGPSSDQPAIGRMAEDFPREPLIVVDPVDPRRNVASPVSAQTLSHSARCARSLLERPSIEPFHPFSSRPIDLDRARAKGPGIANSSGPLISPLPAGNSSIAATQLRRVLNTCISSLRKVGFGSVSVYFCLVFPKGSTVDQGYTRARWSFRSSKIDAPKVAFSIATEPVELGPTREHWGPDIDNERASEFRARWGEGTRHDPATGRLFTIVKRPQTDPVKLLQEAWAVNARGLFGGSILEAPSDMELQRSLASVLTSR